MKKETSFENMKALLTVEYTPPQGQGGHDIGHVLRMVNMYSELTTLIGGVDQREYEVTVWLHNLDRAPAFSDQVRTRSELTSTLMNVLLPLKFTRSAEQRIVTAVMNHSKRYDEPSDSSLLAMLRLADKWDRIGVHGITSSFAWKGCVMPSYNLENPFGYGNTSEGGWRTHYQNFYRILEWYQDFPLIRELVKRHRWRFEAFLAFIRAFAREISEAHEIPNTVEEDIKKCLGEYYDEWR